MLIENNNTDKEFRVNDVVIVSTTKQTGRIVAFENNKWTVLIDGAEQIKESYEIEKRQMLFG